MTLRRSQPAGECVVDDGGVWGRDGVWLSGDGRTLATLEGSGSSGELVFRDASTCAKVGTLDVSGRQWRVQGRTLVLHAAAVKDADRRVPLDAACRTEAVFADSFFPPPLGRAPPHLPNGPFFPLFTLMATLDQCLLDAVKAA